MYPILKGDEGRFVPVHEKIDEYVGAMVFFTDEAMLLRSFFWKNRKYQVERVNLMHRVRDGADWLYFYNLSCGLNCYKLCFSTRSLRWKLVEIYGEG